MFLFLSLVSKNIANKTKYNAKKCVLFFVRANLFATEREVKKLSKFVGR